MTIGDDAEREERRREEEKKRRGEEEKKRSRSRSTFFFPLFFVAFFSLNFLCYLLISITLLSPFVLFFLSQRGRERSARGPVASVHARTSSSCSSLPQAPGRGRRESEAAAIEKGERGDDDDEVDERKDQVKNG